EVPVHRSAAPGVVLISWALPAAVWSIARAIAISALRQSATSRMGLRQAHPLRRGAPERTSARQTPQIEDSNSAIALRDRQQRVGEPGRPRRSVPGDTRHLTTRTPFIPVS